MFLDQLAALPTAYLLLLLLALALILGFEFSNGFHDTANAVATVIYTNALAATPAVLWSGLWNFIGVLLGGTAIAYSVVNLLPVELVDGGDDGHQIAMLLSVLIAALIWNIGTWYFGLPSSSSHAMIGAILGAGLAVSYHPQAGLTAVVNWDKAREVGLALIVSPLMGFVLAAILLIAARRFLTDFRLHKPPHPDERPPRWLRAVLILTCTGVSFAHGSNDGQKSIGLIMIALVSLFPLYYAVDLGHGPAALSTLAAAADRASALTAKHAGSKEEADAATGGARLTNGLQRAAAGAPPSAAERHAMRVDTYHLMAAASAVAARSDVPAEDRAALLSGRGELRGIVEHTPLWVIVLSGICLGLGTMVGYKRIVVTVGEKIGKAHLTPAQGGVAELVAAGTIGLAVVGGVPVSTTHVLSSAVAGTMTTQGSGLHGGTVRSILLAWILTLPATIGLAFGLFFLLDRQLGGLTP